MPHADRRYQSSVSRTTIIGPCCRRRSPDPLETDRAATAEHEGPGQLSLVKSPTHPQGASRFLADKSRGDEPDRLGSDCRRR